MYSATRALVGVTFTALIACGCAAHTPVPVAGAANTPSPDCGTVGMELADRYGSNASLVGDFVSTAGEVDSWNRSYPPGGVGYRTDYAQKPADERVAVCFYDGDFQPPLPGPKGGATPPAVTRIVITVDGGESARLFQIGEPDSLPIEGP